MELPNLENKRVFIIEGIAGSGKTTFFNAIKDNFKDKKIHRYPEEELMLGWKHVHIPNTSKLRLEFLNKVLDHIEKKLEQDKDTIFILERFHISAEILEWEFREDFEKEYNNLLLRVKKLPVHILIPTLDESQIKEKSAHKERGHQWNEYLKEKLKLRNFPDLESLYIAEQKKILELAEKQGISYSILK